MAIWCNSQISYHKNTFELLARKRQSALLQKITKNISIT